MLIASIFVNVIYYYVIEKYKKSCLIYEEHIVLSLQQAETYKKLLADCEKDRRILLSQLKDHKCRISEESLYRSTISLP